ncbi:MAG: PilZ domain-containing protein [Thermodesulfobacteriota bacterium]
MLHNDQRRETRYIPAYGMIAVCESDPKFIGAVLDISLSGMALKSHKKPANKKKHSRIRLMGPRGMKIDNIPMEIVSISKTPSIPAASKQQKGHFHRIGIRLQPESGQAEQINQMIDVIR